MQKAALSRVRKIPAPIKIKLALPNPPPQKKNPKYPDLKRGILWAWGFSCRKNQKSQTPIKLAQPFPPSGSKIADKEFYEHGDCSERGGGLFDELGEGGGAQVPGGCLGGVCKNCFFRSFEVAIL